MLRCATARLRVWRVPLGVLRFRWLCRSWMVLLRRGLQSGAGVNRERVMYPSMLARWR